MHSGCLSVACSALTFRSDMTSEVMQMPKSPSGLKPGKSNLKSSAPLPEKPSRPIPLERPQPPPSVASAVLQTPVSPVSSPRGLRSISMFMPDMARTASNSSNMSTEPLQQGPSSSANAPDDVAGVHSRAYMAQQRQRRGTSFVDASGKSHTFKGVPGQL